MDLNQVRTNFLKMSTQLKFEMEAQLASYLDQYSSDKYHYMETNAKSAWQQVLDYTRELLQHSRVEGLTKDALTSFTEDIQIALGKVQCVVISIELNHTISI